MQTYQFDRETLTRLRGIHDSNMAGPVSIYRHLHRADPPDTLAVEDLAVNFYTQYNATFGERY
jgi:hypothetical protein